LIGDFRRMAHSRSLQAFCLEESMHIVGDKSKLAFVTSPYENHPTSSSLTVDIIVGGRTLTLRDNIVYVPGFTCAMEYSVNYYAKSIEWLLPDSAIDGLNLSEAHLHYFRNEPLRSCFDWGPTTDDISSFLVYYDNAVYLTYFLYSENPDYESNPPIIRGEKLHYLEFLSTLYLQWKLMQEYNTSIVGSQVIVKELIVPRSIDRNTAAYRAEEMAEPSDGPESPNGRFDN
jgi:hypothetical protein